MGGGLRAGHALSPSWGSKRPQATPSDTNTGLRHCRAVDAVERVTGSDAVSQLVGIWGSKDLLVTEYRWVGALVWWDGAVCLVRHWRGVHSTGAVGPVVAGEGLHAGDPLEGQDPHGEGNHPHLIQSGPLPPWPQQQTHHPSHCAGPCWPTGCWPSRATTATGSCAPWSCSSCASGTPSCTPPRSCSR